MGRALINIEASFLKGYLKQMDHRKLVHPQHMNEQGSLFGGYLLKWLDEFAYITASVDYPGNRFVTIALNNVTFKHPIRCGQILCFSVNETHLGRSFGRIPRRSFWRNRSAKRQGRPFCYIDYVRQRDRVRRKIGNSPLAEIWPDENGGCVELLDCAGNSR